MIAYMIHVPIHSEYGDFGDMRNKREVREVKQRRKAVDFREETLDVLLKTKMQREIKDDF
jgi:hypothetical protein